MGLVIDTMCPSMRRKTVISYRGFWRLRPLKIVSLAPLQAPPKFAPHGIVSLFESIFSNGYTSDKMAETAGEVPHKAFDTILTLDFG